MEEGDWEKDTIPLSSLVRQSSSCTSPYTSLFKKENQYSHPMRFRKNDGVSSKDPDYIKYLLPHLIRL